MHKVNSWQPNGVAGSQNISRTKRTHGKDSTAADRQKELANDMHNNKWKKSSKNNKTISEVFCLDGKKATRRFDNIEAWKGFQRRLVEWTTVEA